MPVTPAEEFTGTARFAVVRRLGAGGMGIVFEAIDRESGRRVAIKTLRTVEPSAIFRLKREFRALAEFVHPNVAQMYEMVFDGQWLLVMELIGGATNFREYVRNSHPDLRPDGTSGDSTRDPGALPGATKTAPAFAPTPVVTRVVPAATDAAVTKSFVAVGPSAGPPTPAARGAGPVRLPADSLPDVTRLRGAFRQLCEGVLALHRAGLLHRDLKPGNVLVGPDGTVYLLDFGLVAALTAAHDEGGVIAGTAEYMAPEQAAGCALSEASDWYAVGVMLFEALTGRLPFTGLFLDILSHKQVLDPPAPADLIDGVPADLNDLCVRLLRRDPADRPTGRDVAAVFADGPVADADLPARRPFVGRDRHLADLHRVFDEVRGGRAVVCRVHGRSGAGKSTLLQHFLDGLSHRAVVLAGRCYEQETVPFKGIDDLVDALSQLLDTPGLPVEDLIPDGVAALARVFPVLQRVGPIAAACRSAADATDLIELRREAFRALRDLLGRIAERYPLVLFVDDLQWGDADSAALLAALLAGDRVPAMLVLMAYRSEYAGTSDCLRRLFAAASGPGVRWADVAVEPLSAAEARALARRLLRGDLADIDAVADRIADQSGGGPYFVYELADQLNAGAEVAAVAGASLDDALRARVGRLPADARRLLDVLAVAGHPLRLRYVLEATGLPELSPRLLARLRVEHLIRTTGPGLGAEVETFHDRVREALAGRLSPPEKRAHHAALAATLARVGGVEPETVAGHYEEAGDGETAGRFYAAAVDRAVRTLAFDRAEDFATRALRLARTDQDHAAAAERLIHFYTDTARFRDAYAVGRRAVARLGVRLPASFVPPLFLLDFARAMVRLRGRTPAALSDLPTMADPRLSAAVRLIAAVAKAAYQIRPELCVAVSTKMVNLVLRHGNTPDCAIGYMVFGCIFQGGVLGRHAVGYAFGRLALALVEKYAAERQRAEVNFVVGYFGTSWVRPAADAEALWRDAFDAGRATGDLFHTGCAAAATVQGMLMRGAPLDEVWEASERFLAVLRPAGLREPIGAIESVRQTIRNLQGRTRGPGTLSDETFDEEGYAAGLGAYGSRHFAHFYYVNKMLVAYLWGDLDGAARAARASAGHLKDSPGMLHATEHYFLAGLIETALAERSSWWGRQWRLRRARAARRRLARWAAGCPANFRHKERLVAAELARVAGRPDDARAAYTAAAGSGSLPVVAIALHRGTFVGAPDLRPAAAAYARWGATAIAHSLSVS